MLAYLFALALMGADPTAAGSESLAVLPLNTGEVEPGEWLHKHLMGKVFQAVERRRDKYERIQTPEEIEAYQRQLRHAFLERTPLNARVAGREQRDGYRVEKVIFESQPGHFVTAILYLPEAKPPYPGILVPCGHSANGKARDLYQRAPILIAKSGMAAFCYDPIDQGERHQLLDSEGTPVITRSTQGHNLAGVGAILLGRNTATYRIWDGMRAIDYLASRPEVEGDRIGCTGISGGGTMTAYLMALDDRVQVAAPGCYLTSFRRLLETIGPQDAEQTIFGQLDAGIDHADYLLSRAPKPTLVMTATKDFFDIDGAWDSFRQAKRWYGQLSFPERVDLLEVASGHGFPVEMRVGATRWMRRWLLHVDDAITEPDFEIASDEAVWCTPHGEVMRIEGARSVYDLNAEQEDQLAENRNRFWRDADPPKALEEVRRVTGIRDLAQLPPVVCKEVGSVSREGYRVDKLILSSAPNIPLPVLLFRPDHPTGGNYLYLNQEGKQADAQVNGAVEKLVLDGNVVLAPDLCGIGETQPSGQHSYSSYLPPVWRDGTIAYLLGSSLLAMRTEDILVCARYLGDREPGNSKKINVISVGRTGPTALHAVALESHLFGRLTLKNSLISWSNVVKTPLSRNQFANLVHGALRVYDLPDLVRALSKDNIEIVDPLDAAEQPVQQ